MMRFLFVSFFASAIGESAPDVFGDAEVSCADRKSCGDPDLFLLQEKVRAQLPLRKDQNPHAARASAVARARGNGALQAWPAWEDIFDQVEEVVDQVRDAAQSAADKVIDIADNVTDAAGDVAATAVEIVASRLIKALHLVDTAVSEFTDVTRQAKENLLRGTNMSLQQGLNKTLQQRLVQFESLVDEAFGDLIRVWGDLKGLLETLAETVYRTLDVAHLTALATRAQELFNGVMGHADSFSHYLVRASDDVIGLSRLSRVGASKALRMMNRTLDAGLDQVDQLVDTFDATFVNITLSVGALVNKTLTPEAKARIVASFEDVHQEAKRLITKVREDVEELLLEGVGTVATEIILILPVPTRGGAVRSPGSAALALLLLALTRQ